MITAITAAFVPHDHHACVHDALAQAEALCAARGARLTVLRKRVLELVWTSHQPLGAYPLLDQLTAEGHKPAPPTVYRALEFLLEQKLIHRIASLNAYVGCTQPGANHKAYFLLCTQCGNASELADSESVDKSIYQAAQTAGFAITAQTLELSGVCAQCQRKSA